jgi:hypothetical protein
VLASEFLDLQLTRNQVTFFRKTKIHNRKKTTDLQLTRNQVTFFRKNKKSSTHGLYILFFYNAWHTLIKSCIDFCLYTWTLHFILYFQGFVEKQNCELSTGATKPHLYTWTLHFILYFQGFVEPVDDFCENDLYSDFIRVCHTYTGPVMMCVLYIHIQWTCIVYDECIVYTYTVTVHISYDVCNMYTYIMYAYTFIYTYTTVQ